MLEILSSCSQSFKSFSQKCALISLYPSLFESGPPNFFKRPLQNIQNLYIFELSVPGVYVFSLHIRSSIREYPGHNSRKCDVVVFGASKPRGRRNFCLRNLWSSYLEPREFDVAVFGALKFWHVVIQSLRYYSGLEFGLHNYAKLSYFSNVFSLWQAMAVKLLYTFTALS